MTRLRPFFYYYGAKNRLALEYPAPAHRTIVEPFAGSAAYSLAYPDRRVVLLELDERIAGVWDYLIRAPSREILALPDMPFDAHIDDLPVSQQARWLIGLCIGAASSRGPKHRWSTWTAGHVRKGCGLAPYWTPAHRARIAEQQGAIRHWTIKHADWQRSPTCRATYFVDPPYAVAGQHYRHHSKFLDYAALAAWCIASPGQVIACEADGATWLPFKPFRTVGSQGRRGEVKGGGKLREVMWTNREPTQLEPLRAAPDNDNGFAPHVAAHGRG